MKRPDSSSLTLIVIPATVAATLLVAEFGSRNLQSFWGAVASWLLALAAAFFAASVVPTFRVARTARLAAVIFFIVTALRHAATALVYVTHPDLGTRESIATWYFSTLTVAQAVSLWMFLYGLREANVLQRERLERLRGKPEFGRRASDRAEEDVRA